MLAGPFLLHAQQTGARVQLPDSVPASSVARIPDDSAREGILLDLAWQRYRAKAFAEAASEFAKEIGRAHV